MRFAIIAFLLVAVVASILSDWLIYRDLCFLKKKKKLRIAHLVFATLLYCLLLAAFISLLTPVNSMLFTGWCIFIYLSVFVAKFLYIIFRGISAIPVLFKHKAWKSVQIAGFAVSVACFILLWWNAIVTPRQFDINEVTIESAKLPAAFNGYRIVQFSDLHVGSYASDTSYVAEIVNVINKLQSDVIFFTGDLVNRQTDEAEPFVEVLSRLQAHDGVFSILGNHDYGDYMEWPSPEAKAENNRYMARLQAQMGWSLMNNCDTVITRGNQSITIIGVENWGEPPFSQYGDLVKAHSELNDSNFKILLSHNPKHWRSEVLPSTNIDLTLSGHTHAMQIMVNFFGIKISPSAWIYPEWAGTYCENKQILYVNIGIGEVAMPMRIGATPEITVLTLKKEQKQ